MTEAEYRTRMAELHAQTAANLAEVARNLDRVAADARAPWPVRVWTGVERRAKLRGTDEDIAHMSPTGLATEERRRQCR